MEPDMTLKEAGFTLIETMVVLAIAAIVITLGFPSFNGALQRQRVSTTMHLLSADMAMARSSALMRRSRVVVCSRGESAGCSGGLDWSRGWLVFTDPDGNRIPDADSDILRVTDAPAGDSSILYLPASRSVLSYLPDGRSAGTNLSVHLCREGVHLGKVAVNNLGRVRSERPPAGTPCPRS
jgi:type IV fimbrial biogenesis protein FimT